TLSRSVNVTVFGQVTTITARVAPVSPAVGNPTGTVTFFVDGNPFRTVPVDPATGQASFSTALIPFGVHSVTAAFSGDSNFQASQTTVSQTQEVSLAGTRTIVTPHRVLNRTGGLTA